MKIFNLLATISADSLGIPKVDPNVLTNNVLNTIYIATGAIAVIMIIVAGFIYTTSDGDSAKITKAKNVILYAVVGLVLVILAYAITWFVIGRIS